MLVEVCAPLPWLPVYQLRGSKWWVVLDDHTFELFIDHKKYKIVVPAGYRYDRSSVPWEGFISKDKLGCQGALIHDVLCQYRGHLPTMLDTNSLDPIPAISPSRCFTRPEVDVIFYQVMLADHIAKWRAWIAWQYVRLGKNWKESKQCRSIS